MAREFLQITKESAYKTTMTSPVRNTDQIVIRLDGGNAYDPRAAPMPYIIPYGGGVAIDALTGSDQIGLSGKLTTKGYASQFNFLMNWAITRINVGQTLPWVTTEPFNDLASAAIDYARSYSDASVKRERHTGMKVAGFDLEISRDSKIASLSLDLIGSTYQGNTFDASSDPTTIVFPAPAETDYPTDPYRFIDTAGNLTIGSVRTQYSSIKLSVKNKLDARWFENRFVNVCRFTGRDVTLTAKIMYKPTPADRATFQAITTQTVTFALNNGVHTSTFTLNGQNYITGIKDDFPLDKIYEAELTVKNFWDPSAAADISFAWV